MKITTAVIALLLMAPPGARAQRLQIDHLDRLAERAEETVNVTLDGAMLKGASIFLNANDPKQAVAREFISGLSGIFVRVFEFSQANAYAQSDLDIIRKQLNTPGWSRIVGIDSKRDGEIVDVFLWHKGDQPGGLAILVAEPTELVIVNIVGPIDLSKLGALRGQFGIPDNLPTPTPAPAKE
jgi:hypothetical protein